jgi:hypothetical protein
VSESLRLTFTRQPLREPRVDDVAGMRGWVRDHAAGTWVLAGEMQPLVVLAGDGFVEVGEAPKDDDPDREPIVARIFHALGRRDGVRRRFRAGAALLRDGERLRGALCVLEWLPGAEGEPERYWATWRFAGRGDGGGALHGPWHEAEGSIADLPDGLTGWVDEGGSDDAVHMRAEEGTGRARGGLLWTHVELDMPLPEELPAAAHALFERFSGDLLRRPLPGFLAYLVRGRDVEVFLAPEDPGVPPEVLLRALCWREKPELAALAIPAAVETEARQHRGVALVLERGRHRASVVALMPDGDAVPERLEAWLRDLGDVGGEAWIGVEPGVELTLEPHGPPGGDGVPEA